MIFAYSGMDLVFFLAELRALLIGLRVCKVMGQAPHIIELAKRKGYLKQEMCSMLQPPYSPCVLLVSLLPAGGKCEIRITFLVCLYSSCSDVSPTSLGEFYPSTAASKVG